jgi:hypothetical protein
LPRSGNVLILLADGRVLIARGTISQGSQTKLTPSAEIYNPATGLWTTTRRLSSPRSGATANLLADGKVLVAGGLVGTDGAGDSIEEFDPSTDRWHVLTTTLSSPRSSHTATTLLDGSLIISGGIDSFTLVPTAELLVRPR